MDTHAVDNASKDSIPEATSQRHSNACRESSAERHRLRLPGTVHEGSFSVHQFELLPKPPDNRTADNPWPLWPNVFRVSTAHEEGGDRVYSVSTHRFSGDEQGHVRKLHGSKVELVHKDGRMSFENVPGSDFEMDADLVLLAMGFLGPQRQGLLDNFGVKLTERGNVWRDGNWMTSVPGVFAAGDMQRGQSLIVWAIAEGRSAARGSTCLWRIGPAGTALVTLRDRAELRAEGRVPRA